MTFAKESDLVAGDIVEVVGFTCLDDYTTHTVQSDGTSLYLNCRQGLHFLDGQLEDGDEYIGVYKK